ncbi:MAG: DotU family type IV/VI secretion system protein [Thiohalomonadales bacterium]
MTNCEQSGKLVRCFVDVLLYVNELYSSGEKLQIQSIIKKIDAKFRNSAKISLSLGNDIREYDIARFAVCAWVDEHLMSIDWRYKGEWKNYLLQSKYYGTSNAGVEFYERLSKLGLSRNVVREVYLLCMSIGFRGKYARYEDFTKVISLRDEAIGKLGLNGIQNGNTKIFRDAYPSKQNRDLGSIFTGSYNKRKYTGLAFSWLGAAILLSCVYIGYTMLLNASFTVVSMSGLQL